MRLVAAILLLGSHAAAAQNRARDSLLREGISLAAMEPARAAERFELILGSDSLDLEASWRAAVSLNDVAQELDNSARRRRDSLYARAEAHSRRAVRLAPQEVHSLFALALVLGNASLTRGGKARVRSAVEIRDLARRALAADSTHDGAHHLLGRWHAEVRRLSGLGRLFAKTFLGGGVLGEASWDEAIRHLDRAVALDSTRIYHRLDLARVYLDRKRRDDARVQLTIAAALPLRVLADGRYRREAGELLAKLR